MGENTVKPNHNTQLPFEAPKKDNAATCWSNHCLAVALDEFAYSLPL